MKLSSKSPGKESASHINWKTPNASPYSSSHQTPISYHQSATMRSPLSPYSQSPITRPSLSASPGNSSSNSPGGITYHHYGSPSTYQVRYWCRKLETSILQMMGKLTVNCLWWCLFSAWLLIVLMIHAGFPKILWEAAKARQFIILSCEDYNKHWIISRPSSLKAACPDCKSIS